MEVKDFFKLLKKYISILIIVPAVAIMVTFFLVRNLPDEYVSNSRIATGIVDQTRQLLDQNETNVQDTKIYTEFSNLMEVMKLKKMYDMVSYNLILHDLNSKTPFRKSSKMMASLTVQQWKDAVAIFNYKLKHLEGLSLVNPKENSLNKMLIEMRYDERSLSKAITITREDFSDFIIVSASSENPQLSAYIVNTLCQGFIDYHTKIVQQNELAAVRYLSNLLNERRDTLAVKTGKLQNYKIKNDVLDLEDQSKTVYGQIVEYQNKLIEAQKNMASYTGALDNIDKKFDPKSRKFIEQNVSKINSQLTTSMDQLHALNDRWVMSNFDPKIKTAIDSLQKKVTNQALQSNDAYILDPLQTKSDLLRQRLELEMNYNLTKYSLKSIQQQLDNLNANFKRMVPLDAKVKTYQMEIEIASKEYQDVQNRYNNAVLQSKSETKLMQIEKAEPDVAEPSKKLLLIVLAGVGGEMICLVIFFAMFFLDNSIKDPVRLANRTSLPVLGYLNRIPGSTIDLRRLWDVEHRDRMQQYKDLLRAIRFEVDQELAGEKVVAVTSMRDGEGKTLLASTLAYSYNMINKKVLLIDGNMENPTISHSVQPKVFIEDFFRNDPSNAPAISQAVGVLGNRGEDVTLLEISSEVFLRNKFTELKQIYDIILIDIPSLSAKNKAKEWMLFANKVIVVFEADQDIVEGRKQLVKELQQLNTTGKFAGWVLNKAAYQSKKRG
ncbi:uncharacterized protein involved in exopolysaccharide biosynthesis [Mucilaginibacter yixingensis]|uniref:Uncharacterized protein involved in exopolysaccharide biosynthesis n=1 Tax=Mucilaginibacter yixingensis TaxID=1295612 RepID=A0A2T5JEX1_9SPHI|nr:AAA family ATPase [Mucilaginibacter yixingensis]PTR00934.1 uncharacterized protein involved in exopolysaccharide biosynthesis [Mucilaginibacter yixingensis]